MNNKRNFFSSLFILFIYLKHFEASSGDRSTHFLRCCENCKQNFDCPKKFDEFGWVQGSCFWCRYDCMWKTLEYFERNAGFIPQFYGKWPFFALPFPDFGLNLGIIIQEPASMIFSLLNLLSMFICLKRIKKLKNLEPRIEWIVYLHIGMLAWVCSTFFHMFDCSITEKMDYFAAFLFILSGFYLSLIFTVPSLSRTYTGRKRAKIILATFVLYYIGHVIFMSNWFLYSYNMKICIFTGLATAVTYLIYMIKRSWKFGYLHRNDYILLKIIIWANLASALEILDFAPIFWIFDSHSLFHLGTVPIAIWWADYLEKIDSRDFEDDKLFVHKIA